MKTINCPLPKELSKVLDSAMFDDEAGIVIKSVQFTERDVHIMFAIIFGEDGTREVWNVKVTNVEEEQIIPSWTQNISIYQEHILLLDYNDEYAELYFNGLATNPDELFIDIFKSIKQLSENTSHILKYILSPEHISQLSSWGYGLFARGPKTVLDLYAKCIEKHEMKSNFIRSKSSIQERKQLKLLEIGDSYFIGESILFERISNGR